MSDFFCDPLEDKMVCIQGVTKINAFILTGNSTQELVK
jgi:hypothetical protein